MICNGSYLPGIRRHPLTGSAECGHCGLRFDKDDMAGAGANVPGHSPLEYPRGVIDLRRMTRHAAPPLESGRKYK